MAMTRIVTGRITRSLDAERGKQIEDIRLIHNQVVPRIDELLDFIEGAEKPHLGGGVLLVGVKVAAMSKAPCFEAARRDEDSERKGGALVGGHNERVIGTRSLPFRAHDRTAGVKVILIRNSGFPRI